MALRDAKVGSLLEKSCGSTALFFVAHALLMIDISPIAICEIGLGDAVVNSTV